MTTPSLNVQRSAERLGALLPRAPRIRLERRIRGWFDARRLREADVVFVSFGKSGRTWVRVLISRMYQLVYGVTDELIEFDNYHARNAAVPKVLFTHDNYLRDYTGHGGGKQAYAGKKVCLLVRHPADVAVSQYFQWKHRMRGHKVMLNDYPPVDDTLSAGDFLMGRAGISRIITFMNEWAEALPQVPDLLTVRFEDLKADTAAELDRLCAHLGMRDYAGYLRAAVDYASFDNMRQREAEAANASARLSAGDTTNPDSFKSRRGKAGAWREYLDAQQIARVDQVVTTTLAPIFGYTAEKPS